MKTYSAILIVSYFFIFCNSSIYSQCNPFNNDETKFIGNIKTIKSTKYHLSIYKGEEKISESGYSDIFGWDDIGDINTPDIYILKFNKENILIEKETYLNDLNINKCRQNYKYSYDDKKRLIKIVKECSDMGRFPSGDTKNFICKYSYDNVDNKIEEFWDVNDFDGEDYYKVVYEYNSNNNIISEKLINSNGMIDYKIDNVYNDYGYIVESNKIEKSEIFKNTIYFYDSKNNLIKKENYLSGRLSRTDEYKFDDNNNLISYKTSNDYNPLGRFSSYKIEKYDNECNILQEIRDDNTITYVYDYDIKGNWINKKVYNNGMPIKSIKREIEYY